MLRPGSCLQAADLLPHPRHGARVEHLQLELAHVLGDGAAVQLHQHGERRDLPHGGLDPRPLEGQLVLVAAALQVVGGKAEVLEPLDELGREHLPLAVEHVAAQEGRLAAAQAQRADVVELLLERADVDQPAELDVRGAVDDAERDPRVLVAAIDRLRHQQLVEIRVQHRADDRVDLPGVVVDAGGDVGHEGRSAGGKPAPRDDRTEASLAGSAAGAQFGSVPNATPQAYAKFGSRPRR